MKSEEMRKIRKNGEWEKVGNIRVDSTRFETDFERERVKMGGNWMINGKSWEIYRRVRNEIKN